MTVLRTRRDTTCGRAFVFAFVLGAFAGCAQRIPPMVNASDAQRANVQLADLEVGRTVLIRKCGGCHQPPMPSDHTAAEWPSKLDEMSMRADLHADERRAIQQY